MLNRDFMVFSNIRVGDRTTKRTQFLAKAYKPVD